MQTVQSFIQKWGKRKRTYAILILVVFILFLILKPKTNNDIVVDTVKLQNLESTVLATGKITSNTDLSLSFNTTGIVRGLKVKVGDKVSAGTVLSSLDSGSAYGAVLSAQGALASAKAKYQQVLDGTSNEEIKIAEIALENAKKDFTVENARKKLFSSDLVALPEDPDQVNEAPVITGLYTGTQEGKYTLYFSGASTYFVEYFGLESGKTYVSESPQPLGTRGLFIEFPAEDYYPSDSWEVYIPNKSGASYTANLNAYNAAVAEMQSNIAEAQANLNLKKAQASQADLELARADVLSAEGQVQTAQAKYEDTVIRAPASGTITKVNFKLGELAEAQQEAIVLQDVDNLYLEANINEANIIKIKPGQKVTFSIDSFGPDVVFEGVVTHVDPGASIEDGIVNYKIQISISDADSRIRPGMNANIKVLIDKRDNVLVVPKLSLLERDGKMYARVITDEKRKKFIEREVVVGLEGDGNLVEIESGIQEGELIALLSKAI